MLADLSAPTPVHAGRLWGHQQCLRKLTDLQSLLVMQRGRAMWKNFFPMLTSVQILLSMQRGCGVCKSLSQCSKICTTVRGMQRGSVMCKSICQS